MTMTDDRPRHLFTAAEAEKLFGIPAATIRQWRKRRVIFHYGLSRRGQPMYDRDHLIALRDNRLTGKQRRATSRNRRQT